MRSVLSRRYEQQQSLLGELEAARYRLDEYLIELNLSILKRMKKAYLKYNSTDCPEYKTVMKEILREIESQMQPYIEEFRKGFTKYRSFIGKKAVGSLKTPSKGKFGTVSVSVPKHECIHHARLSDCDSCILFHHPTLIPNIRARDLFNNLKKKNDETRYLYKLVEIRKQTSASIVLACVKITYRTKPMSRAFLFFCRS